MGQKIDPRGHRVGITQDWPCERYSHSQQQSSSFFVEDVKIRELIESFYYRSAIGKVVIRKTDKEGEVILFTAKPATIIGKSGETLAKFQGKLESLTKRPFKVTVKEIKVPELSAKIMSEFACMQLENRMSYRRVSKSILQKVMEKGAVGVKVQIGGRLGGADMSRSEKFTDGRIPLQTLRADIDYHYTTAKTKYGILGVKVRICKSENISITKKKSAMDRI